MLTGLSLRPSSSPTRTKQRTSHRRAVSRLQSPLISATRGQLDAKVGAYRTGDPPRVFRPHFRWQAVVDQHIALYVNEFTRDLGDEGYAAASALLGRAHAAGLVPSAPALR